MGPRRARLIGAIRWALCFLILGFVGRYVLLNWPALADATRPIAGWLVLGSVMALAGLLASAWICRLLVMAHGLSLGYSKAIGLVSIPKLGKYIPGKVWAVLAAFWMYGREGIPAPVTAACVGLSLMLGVLSAIAVAVSLGLVGAAPSASPWLLTVIALALLICIHPRVLYAGANWGLRALRRPELATRLSFPVLLGLVTLNMAGVVLYGSGFFCVVRSVSPVAVASAPDIVALFVFAQIAGFVAFFAPAGIGVREGVLLVGLQPIVGPGPAIVITGVTRLWQTALELLMAGIGWVGLRYGGRVRPAVGNEINGNAPEGAGPGETNEVAHSGKEAATAAAGLREDDSKRAETRTEPVPQP